MISLLESTVFEARKRCTGWGGKCLGGRLADQAVGLPRFRYHFDHRAIHSVMQLQAYPRCCGEKLWG